MPVPLVVTVVMPVVVLRVARVALRVPVAARPLRAPRVLAAMVAWPVSVAQAPRAVRAIPVRPVRPRVPPVRRALPAVSVARVALVALAEPVAQLAEPAALRV